MQSTRGAAILAAVAVLTGGLTACGDDSEPQESTTTASPIDRSTDPLFVGVELFVGV